MKRITAVIMAYLMTVFFAGTGAIAGRIEPELDKILQHLAPDEEISVIVALADKVNLENFRDKDRKVRRSRIIKALKSKADKTQKNIKNFLQLHKAKKIKSYWIFNGLAVTAGAGVIHKLAAADGVESIHPDAELIMPEPLAAAAASPPEWNLIAIRVPELWNKGYKGSSLVFASMDTGVDYNHPDLASRWRGGSNSWYDPYGEHETPYDISGHGTGVMSILVGGDVGGYPIGIAPDAKWISVKVFNDAGLSYESSILSGYQWLLDPDGVTETDDAPDVINNSWGYPYESGCHLYTYFQTVLQTLKLSGIGLVYSAGNHGNRGPSTDESPANYPESFAVGAVAENQTIAFFSARGPSSCDESIFPEVVAPGVNVRIADLGSYYRYDQGTSLAAPHVSGAMGLLMSVFSSLGITDIERAITESAKDLGAIGLDNTYGNGLLDALGAYSLLSQEHSQPPVANNDLFTIPRNSAALLNILENDRDDGTIDRASVIFRSGTAEGSTARGGSITANPDGTVSYSPEGGGGPDYFWYRVRDGNGVTSGEAKVRINRVRGIPGAEMVIPNSLKKTTR